jgi:NAD-dependent dihydropyrimidine dehydrogenase PreA subunit
MRADAIFIGVEVDDPHAGDAAIAAKLTEVCPVDIFRQEDDGTLEIVVHNLDECVLCGLCLEAAPPGGMRVFKVYDEGAVLQRT